MAMGIFTPKETIELQEARAQQTTTVTVCPHCLQECDLGASTLQAANPALGVTMHRCPKCGQLITV